jgi:16S rRNA (adenine1518-N6/adenine1519-N6)-dimethyltransferase
VVEIDRDLIRHLKAWYPDLLIHEGDVLELDFTPLLERDNKTTLVGNLPYNISTPLIFYLLQYSDCIEAMYFLLQKEVVDRMVSEPGKKSYGKLSVMTQYQCNVEALFDIPPECFRPAPKVQSTFVKLVPRAFHTPCENMEQLSTIVSTAFNQRRKTLKNSLAALFEDKDKKHFEDILGLRAENLSVEDYVQLSNKLASGEFQ